ncbi:CoA ester lyase [Actinomycetaceae bacterium MB13-C1-2]|nr:CoA ester lyase [Actinomycetaceae bacterium MB13-C1-2]
MTTPVTLLYVPADRPDRIPKALNSGAEAVIVDLEDAIAPSVKDTVRANLREMLEGLSSDFPQVQVRVNGPQTPWFEKDCEAVNALPDSVMIRIPKVENAEQVGMLVQNLPGRKLHLLIETALGVQNLFQIASAHTAVTSVSLGELDLRSSTGISSDSGLDWIRTRLVIAVRAAGLEAPTMSVYPQIRDDEGLLVSSRHGETLGFRGRCALHPRQLPIIRDAFRPPREKLLRAEELLSKLKNSIDSNSGVAMLADGSFVDAAAIDAAKETVALSKKLGSA